jgi:hypothetical protein
LCIFSLFSVFPMIFFISFFLQEKSFINLIVLLFSFYTLIRNVPYISVLCSKGRCHEWYTINTSEPTRYH